MSTNFLDDEWSLSEVLGHPQLMFVLWALHQGFCSTAEDFHHHFGEPLPVNALVDALKKHNLIEEVHSRLMMTLIGKQLVSSFQKVQLGRDTATMDATNSQPMSDPIVRNAYGFPFADADEQPPRRFPVYFLIDCSGSMQGQRINSVNQSLQETWQQLIADPKTADSVVITIIPFADSAYQMGPTPIRHFVPPILSASGATSLGAALRLLDESITNDIRPNSALQRGDYKPLIFLLTDGQPTDEWQSAAQDLRTRSGRRTMNMVGLAIGEDADVAVLHQITSATLKLNDSSATNLRTFFSWVSQSVSAASHAANSPSITNLPPLPPGIAIEL